MSGVEPRRERVAELIVTRPDEVGRGSGYLVAPGLVLTAAHVVAAATEVKIRFEADLPGERSVYALNWQGLGDTDLALVAIPAEEGVGDPTRYGQVGDHAARVSVQSVGFPLWKLRDHPEGGKYRDSHHAFGKVALLSNWRDHTLEITVGPPPRDPDPNKSPWEGMSGAAVWADGRIIGVMKAHHRGDGLSRLAATPLGDALRTLQPAELTGFRNLLPALPAPWDLVDVTPRQPADRPHSSEVAVGRSRERAAHLRRYLELIGENFRWLKLHGIDEAGSLQIELEQVYVALKAEPESEYDLTHLARLHAHEIREAAGDAGIDSIAPARLAELDAHVVRRSYRPRREEAQRAKIAEVATIADAFRRHHRMVILGGPGSGKSTLGRWLALQLARGMLDQSAREVPPEAEPAPPDAVRVHVTAGTAFSFARRHFVPSDRADGVSAVVIDAVPVRGTLALSGTPVTVGQAVPLDQVERLTYTPAGEECGFRYVRLAFSVGDDPATRSGGVLVFDVGLHIRVPVSRVDPDQVTPDGAERTVDMGPARVPIFLRLAHFAHELAERERERLPGLSLEEYLGRDPDLPGGDADDRNAMLRALLAEGRAVVILDGLDELPEANRRTVLLEVQSFIDRLGEPNATDERDEPWRAGGNQVIVTSRYVGYKAMSVRAGCAHLGIQPMRRPAVEHFARMWTAAVNAELAADASSRPVADALIREIYDDSRPAIRELATNPLLVTILATVYWADGRLPDQRAAVYDRVVENLLRIWLARPECRVHSLTRDELLAALEPLAADMQDNTRDNGLVDLDRISELIEGPLALMRGASPADRAFRPVLRDLLTTIRKHVGLLAEQASGNYAFAHRTFQEFLAARHILAARERAASTIVERLDDPHWREPLLLALGLAMISTEWGGPRARAQLIRDVLAGDDQDPMIPRAAMLLVDALPDLEDVPEGVVGQLVGRLLRSYALSRDQPEAEGVRESICAAFARLRDGPRGELVAEAVAEAVRRPPAEGDLSGAAAMVLVRTGWFTTDIVDALLEKTHQDHDGSRWPIRWALVAALARPVGEPPWRKRAAGLNMPRLLAAHLPMRRLLESRPDLTAFVRGDVDWLWLMTALYGGLGRGDVQQDLRAYQLKRLRRLRPVVTDPAEEAPGPPPPVPPVEFCPGDIVHDLADAELSRAVQRLLRARGPARELAETFRRGWERGADPAGRADAIVGLAALGEDVVPMIREALDDDARRPAAQSALGRFRWLWSLLREPLLRSAEAAARTIPSEAPEEHQLDLLRVVIDGHVSADGGPLQVSDVVPEYRFVDATSEPIRAALDAEYWSYAFSGLAVDGPGGTASGAAPGAFSAAHLRSPDSVVRGWSRARRARNDLARQRLPWPEPASAPRSATRVDHYLAMLDGLWEAPSELDYTAGHLLGRCSPLVDAHPDLFWETLAVCCGRGAAFRTGFRTGVADARADGPAGQAGPTCSSVASDVVLSWAEGFVEPGEAANVRDIVTGMFRLGEEDVYDPDGRTPRPESVSSASTYAARIRTPYLRFRALWRLLDALGDLDVALANRTVTQALFKIIDPHDLVRAFEMIAVTVTSTLADAVAVEFLGADGLVQKVGGVRDPEKRARSLVRLAGLMPDRSAELLDAAVDSIVRIDDRRRRAEEIDGMRGVLDEFSRPVAALDAAAEEIDDPWLRHLASGRASRLIEGYRDRYTRGALAWRLPPDTAAVAFRSHRLGSPTGHLPWGLLYLNAVAAEVDRIEAVPTGGGAAWEQLTGPDPRAAVDALIEAAGGGGVRVTPREAAVLGRVVESGGTEVLRPLWAHLECTDAAALAIVARLDGTDGVVRRWKALVQVESGRLTPENLVAVIDLLAESTDRLRFRAALALHGRRPTSHNRNRRWSVKRVGTRVVEILAEQARRLDIPRSVRTSLRWVQHDVHHDDAEALDHWMSAASRDDPAAAWILGSVESLDPALVTRLADALPGAAPALQRTLIEALARLAYLNPTNLAASRDSVCTAIASVPEPTRRAASVLLNGPATCLKVAEQAVAEYDTDEARHAGAVKMIEGSSVWLDDECLADSEACMKRLRELAFNHYLPGGYWSQPYAVAATLSGDEDVLRLLLSLVESASLNDEPELVLGDLLAATCALAEASPYAFTASADPDVWESILTELAEVGYQWNTRLAAVRLLGLLRRVSGNVVAALRTAVNDVSPVQEAAYASAEQFRHMQRDVIPDLLALLDLPDAGVAASTTRLLVGLAKAEGATTDRRRILRGLREKAAGSERPRHVYLMRSNDTTGEMWIEHVDRLDRILYRAILDIRGW
ncbi:NACHT domain-containing protein [Actinomadura livida]|uniref:Serine protease n=1 Tax=Actinomadura livida TaxID=79909 RepID=A0ABP3NIU1_9ACTN|nr:trypsin-like peptidase domain-containing protein [Actinomadura livida]GGU02113.1 hypothetical protein GCM10010208_27450 [Actinomadura livida]